VIADVQRYRAYQVELDCVKWWKVELQNEEDRAQSKLLTVKRYLAHAAVRTCLTPHLLKTRPPSPPATFPIPYIPRIFAGQGPSDDEDTDTCTVLGKRLRCHPQKPVFPYCLRCNKSDPDHSRDLCPLSKTC